MRRRFPTFAVLVSGGLLAAGALLAPPLTAETATEGDPAKPSIDLAAGVAADGRRKAGMCRTCHGLDGVARIPIAPHIGGEPAAYIAHQLDAFRSGAREHEMMSVVARSLSDQDIVDLAAWYASLSATATPPAGHDPDDAPADCAGCHGVDGMATIEDAPHLAGESEIYILTQLKAFKFDKRTHEIMTPIAKELSDDDAKAAARWYAAVTYEVAAPD